MEPKTPFTWTEANVRKLRDLYETDMSVNDIAKKLGATPRSVQAKANREGLSKHRSFTYTSCMKAIQKIHGDKFSYEYAEDFKGVTTKVRTVCATCGEVAVKQAYSLLEGDGCAPCARQTGATARSLKAAASFVEKSRKIHGDKFNYDKVRYEKAKAYVTITCPVHGDFEQWPTNHLSGKGCPKCANELTGTKLSMGLDNFILKAKEVHGDLYDYSRTVYGSNNTDKVLIICAVHREFLQAAANHLAGAGCPKCSREDQSKRQASTTKDFVARARLVHGDKYDYSKVEYVNQRGLVKIICPKHGPFVQSAGNHLDQESGCPSCGTESRVVKRSMPLDVFISRSREVHGNKYDYSQVEYKNNREPVTIVCPDHGPFSQAPGNHLHGQQNCPSCATVISKPHQTLIDYLNSLAVKHVANDRSLLGGRREVDILIPDKNLAVEINGLYHHRHSVLKDRNYHQRKTDDCADVGVQLFHFWDSEIIRKPEIVKSMLLSKLGMIERRVFARKCKVVMSVPNEEFQMFLEDSHIQGRTSAGIRVGLEFDGELVAVMGFVRHTEKEVIEEGPDKGEVRVLKGLQLVRFASKLNTTVVGGFSRLLSFVVNNFRHELEVIVSFSDDAYSNGGVYDTNGFEYKGTNPPRLHYTDGYELFNRRSFQRKAMLARDPSLDPSLTEEEMAEASEVYKIFGSSTRKWVLYVS